MKVLSKKEPKARKEHVCNWCGGVIEVGEVYDCSFNSYCGDVYTWKNHKRCMSIAHKLNMFENCDEGVNEEDFQTCITQSFTDLKEEKENIIIIYNDLPKFSDQLDYVCNHYNIKQMSYEMP